MRTLIPSLHDTIHPLHPGPLLADLFLILSLSGQVDNIFWVNIFTAAGQGSQMAADGVWVGGLFSSSYLCCMLYTYIHTATYVLQRAATVIARRHTEVPANERVSQEQSPSLYERRTAHLLQGGVASSYHLPHLLTNKSFKHNCKYKQKYKYTPLYEKRTARISASSWRRSSFFQPFHLLESGFGQ